MRWTISADPSPEAVAVLASDLHVDPAIASLLIQRGVDTYDKAKKFFRPSFDDLYDPFLMKDMDKAVARIEQAIASEERIMVYGDYDVDGTTSVALMSTYLRTTYEYITTYIPDRYEEGYGVSFQGIDYALDNDISLIIALDCGIKAIDKVAYAKSKGLDFIICDHHRPGKQLPEAIAVLDPKREDCLYPYKELCGCGVGFKLISALSRKRKEPFTTLIPYLDLVVTAIAADIVPITDENRTLAYFGMQQINHAPRPGFEAIMQGVEKEELSITDVVFIIAPRINAAGRMKHGNHAVSLLTETEYTTACLYAQEIEQFNADRRATDEQITKEALTQITKLKEEDRKTTVVFDKNWHKGVIGIVASRLIETYYRPTLVFTQSGNKLAASARSVKGFDIYNALEACSEHIEQFGGHKYAAGLTLLPENYASFKKAFETVVSTSIEERLLVPELNVDMTMDLNQITPKFYRILKQFAPFGPGNMRPQFLSRHLKDTGYGKCVGADKTHLKITVTQSDHPTTTIGGIGFGLGAKAPLITSKKPFMAVYTLDENEWNGQTNIQLKLKDIKT